MLKRRATPSVYAAEHPPDLSRDADDDLLVLMTRKKDDPAGACEAWAELYRRHSTYLFGVCLKAFGKTLKTADRVSDLVTDVFNRVYEHAESFKPSGLNDREAMRKRVRAWLGTIARRLFLDHLRPNEALPRECQLDQNHWLNIPKAQAADESDNPLIAVVKAAMEKVLTEREREVLSVTLHWYDASSDHQRLPNEVAADLAKRLGTTPENLRKIRERGLAKIDEEVIKVRGSWPFDR
jgi:RNA polymerase sigma factor (sigma-70 family)